MSVQSVYFAFHTKANLLQAALDRAAPQPSPRLAEADPTGRWSSSSRMRCGPWRPRVRWLSPRRPPRPATQPSTRCGSATTANVRKQALDLVQHLRNRRPLARGVTARRVTDVVYGLLSPQLHALLVRERGWTTKRYAAWSADAIGRALWG